MRLLLATICLLLFCLIAPAQTKTSPATPTSVSRPKLVVGIVIDQMRWDYLYRYYDRYAADGGFKRLLNQGFSCENTLIPYVPTITACGHTCIYTGSVPAIHGIIGNGWYDPQRKRSVYCTEDSSVTTVGAAAGAPGAMSPRNMFVTTIGDELKLATNFRSKVIGVAVKDRGGILPAGHSADAAYWYDSRNGNWITSTYYMNELPKWVQDFNARKLVDKYYAMGWNTLYPINTYLQSTADEKPYEGKPLGADQKGFPYDLTKFTNTNYGAVCSTPYGNSMTIEMAKEALVNEKLGADNFTDLLAVSFSSPDYIGHAFGPNSVEQEDDYLRLDKELGGFFNFLDAKVGKGQYLVFLSADHAVAHVPGFMKEHKLPGGSAPAGRWLQELGKILSAKFGNGKLIIGNYNHQLYLDHNLIDSLKLDEAAIKKTIVQYLGRQPEIARVFALDKLMEEPLTAKQRDMVANGYNQRLSGDIEVMLQSNYMEGGATGTTHSAWNPYDSHIPLLFYGWRVPAGKTNRETYMTDIAPTLAAMLRIQMPSGNVGAVIPEVVK
ncbi:alkaline phosphatase PafA [Longitalea arenae]|uniref:alkaline phosphatase PafA n=1 Tax=Longitalea arenae TaxID=2812558 RepID=UPI001F08402A|nr:alkaline phosphatase PafA [Longitalea arenae]